MGFLRNLTSDPSLVEITIWLISGFYLAAGRFQNKFLTAWSELVNDIQYEKRKLTDQNSQRGGKKFRLHQSG